MEQPTTCEATRPPAPPPDATPDPRLRSGALVAGRYRVLERIGRGGMGEVYAVCDLALGVEVALKTIRPELDRRADAVRRFKREVLLARSVTHPSVCRVYDLGTEERDDGLLHFLTMELLRGESLLERLRARGPLPVSEALPLCRDMAGALEAAHRAGIVHRDFKPGNVMLVHRDGRERAIVTDFGLAMAASPGTGETRMATAGTPAYMAPEQVEGARVGAPADIYAFGVVLFCIRTGRLPSRSAGPSSATTLPGEAPSALDLMPAVEPPWREVIARCLRRMPEERFASARAAVEALAGEPEPPAPPAPPRRLRAERDPFVGRAAELAELGRRLAATPLVTLVGPAGAGKTRLALHYAWGTLRDWPGGAWFCDLAEARDRTGLFAAVASGLDVPLGQADPAARIGLAIAGRGRCLVLLDNFEQLAPFAEEILGGWLAAAPGARFLVTSRERLRLAQGDALAIEPLGEELACELLLERARAHRPGISLEGREGEGLRRIARLLDGLPLALELAAARLRLLTPEQLADRLGDRFRVLAGGPQGRHRTLATALDASWELLDAAERAALARLTVFEGGFALEAAEELLAADGTTPQRPGIDLLQSLVDKSLLRVWVPEPRAASRFELLGSVQQYASAKLDPGEREESERRHGRHYARLGAPEAIAELARGGEGERRRALELERDNLRAACERAIARGDGVVAVGAFAAWSEVVERSGPLGPAVPLGEELVGLPSLSAIERARALGLLGRRLRLLGQHAEARQRLEEALAIQRAHDHPDQYLSLGQLGVLAQNTGSWEESRTRFEQALVGHRRSGARQAESSALTNLALLTLQQGRVEEATEQFARALALQREDGNVEGEALTLANLAMVHYEQGGFEEAAQLLQGALELQRAMGNRRVEGITLGNRGLVLADLGRSSAARADLERALAILREIGDLPFEALVLANLGQLHLDDGALVEAGEVIARVLPLVEQVGERRVRGAVLGQLATLRLREGNLAEAREAAERGEALLREAGDAVELGKLVCARGGIELASGAPARAREALAEAEALAQRVRARPRSALGRAIAGLRERLDRAGAG